jgi:hypothetical protein
MAQNQGCEIHKGNRVIETARQALNLIFLRTGFSNPSLHLYIPLIVGTFRSPNTHIKKKGKYTYETLF